MDARAQKNITILRSTPYNLVQEGHVLYFTINDDTSSVSNPAKNKSDQKSESKDEKKE